MSAHIVPKRVYYSVFATLMLFTLVTAQVAFFDLGPFNIVVALSIAVFKALLVVLYFMHVRYSPKLTWIVVAGGLFWLAIMILLTLSDFLSRSWLLR